MVADSAYLQQLEQADIRGKILNFEIAVIGEKLVVWRTDMCDRVCGLKAS